MTEKIEMEEGDYDMLRYFHEEKGDMTRYAQWDALLPLLKKKHPELITAMRNLRAAKRTLDAIVANLGPDSGQEDDDLG